MEVGKMIFLSKWVIYRFHVNLPVIFQTSIFGFHVTSQLWSHQSHGGIQSLSPRVARLLPFGSPGPPRCQEEVLKICKFSACRGSTYRILMGVRASNIIWLIYMVNVSVYNRYKWIYLYIMHGSYGVILPLGHNKKVSDITGSRGDVRQTYGKKTSFYKLTWHIWIQHTLDV